MGENRLRDFLGTSEYRWMTQMNQRITEQPEITLVSPEGKIVRTSEYFECPAEIIIGQNGVAFDGWVSF